MFKRHRSRRDRAIDILTKYLKLKAAGKAVKGAAKAVKWTTYGKAAKTAVQRTPKKGLLAAAGGAGTAAAVAAARKRRSESPTTA
jgi:hypothetical protein